MENCLIILRVTYTDSSNFLDVIDRWARDLFEGHLR